MALCDFSMKLCAYCAGGGGRFFSYTPSKASDAFCNPGSARFVDGSTLEGIKREDSPYYDSPYPFRFISPDEYATALEARGLCVTYSETVARTYRGGKEYFEFVVIVGEQPAGGVS